MFYSSDDFGTFTTNKTTDPLNLANPSANVATTTASPTTTKNSASAADNFSFATNATVGLYLTLPAQYHCDHGDLHRWSAFVKHTNALYLGAEMSFTVRNSVRIYS